MKDFIQVTNKTYKFSSCEICEANCCNGKKGTTFAQILKEDFQEIYENFPILFIYGDMGYLKPVVLLTNSLGFCRYTKDFKCSIYDKRPSICRVYPLSAHIIDINYIDVNCPAVNLSEGKLIVNDGEVQKDFFHPLLENYQEKYIQTHLHFEKFNDKSYTKKIFTLNGVEFFVFKGNHSDELLDLHIKSLENLKHEYYKDIVIL